MKFIFQRENVERRQKLKKLVNSIGSIYEFDKLLDELEQSNFDTGMEIIKRQVADKMEELNIRLIEE